MRGVAKEQKHNILIVAKARKKCGQNVLVKRGVAKEQKHNIMIVANVDKMKRGSIS